jgi:aryl-alcohol dehydrogenase-like predicted oxidoreductase
MKTLPIRILGASKIGNLSKRDGVNLLTMLNDYGITYIDTAPTYPGSEEVIGKFKSSHRNQELKIITKYGRGVQSLNALTLQNSLSKSLRKLKVGNLFALSIHNRDEKDIPKEIFELATEFKSTGLINMFGWCGDWDKIPRHSLKNFDFLMVPVNPYIPRITEKLSKIDVPIIAINPFANFFWNYKKWNKFEKFYYERLKRRFNPSPKYYSENLTIPPKSLDDMLKFVLNLNKIEGIVFGSTKVKHISEITESFNAHQKVIKGRLGY